MYSCNNKMHMSRLTVCQLLSVYYKNHRERCKRDKSNYRSRIDKFEEISITIRIIVHSPHSHNKSSAIKEELHRVRRGTMTGPNSMEEPLFTVQVGK